MTHTSTSHVDTKAPEPETAQRVEWLAWLVRRRGGRWVEKLGYREPAGWYSYRAWRARRAARNG